MGLLVPNRRLFVDGLLVAPTSSAVGPDFRYDEERGLNVLADGRPVVEVSVSGGTETLTKTDGERGGGDADSSEAFAGTMTSTAIRAEREDADAASATWGATQVDTRQGGGDVETDQPL